MFFNVRQNLIELLLWLRQQRGYRHMEEGKRHAEFPNLFIHSKDLLFVIWD